MTDEIPSKAPVYVSYLTFTNLLDWLRELQMLPSQFDRSFWGSKYSGATGSQLMTGLRFLGLLDGERPTDRLERLAMATESERKALIAELLRDVYGRELVDGLPRATPKMVRDALMERGATEATFRKAQSFFINAAKAADLPMPASIAKQARNKPAARSTGSKPKRGSPEQAKAGDPPTQAPVGRVDPPSGLHPAVATILADLPRIGPRWTQEERDIWQATFIAVRDYAYPVQTEDAK